MGKSTLIVSLLTVVATCQSPPEWQATPEERSRQILSEALKDGNPDTRKEAVLVLSLIGPREPYLGQLGAMLRDKDVEVRLAVISTLLDLKSRKAVAILRTALADPVPEVSFAAAQALFRRHDPAGRDTLLSVLSGDTQTSSGYVTKEIREAMRMLHTPKTTFLYVVHVGIGFAPVPGLGEGIASLEGLLSHPGTSGRAAAALLLEGDRSERTLQALRAALADKDWSVRAAAVHSLALRDDSGSRPEFVHLLDDDSRPVRLRAAAAILRFVH